MQGVSDGRHHGSQLRLVVAPKLAPHLQHYTIKLMVLRQGGRGGGGEGGGGGREGGGGQTYNTQPSLFMATSD